MFLFVVVLSFLVCVFPPQKVTSIYSVEAMFLNMFAKLVNLYDYIRTTNTASTVALICRCHKMHSSAVTQNKGFGNYQRNHFRSDNPEFQTYVNPEVQTHGNPEFQTHGNPEFQTHGNP